MPSKDWHVMSIYNITTQPLNIQVSVTKEAAHVCMLFSYNWLRLTFYFIV